jgi:hypothetical protein
MLEASPIPRNGQNHFIFAAAAGRSGIAHE